MLAGARSCELGDTPSCIRACELGHSNSCALAADAEPDRSRAETLHRRACDGGSGLGCEAVGDLRAARFYLRVHCEQAHARSCRALGRIFAEARGGPADPGAAATFLRRLP